MGGWWMDNEDRRVTVVVERMGSNNSGDGEGNGDGDGLQQVWVLIRPIRMPFG